MKIDCDLAALPLPTGVHARYVDTGTGLRQHYLEAGGPDAHADGDVIQEGPSPTVLLLHGFPELAYSWRKVMPALAAAGYRVIAPDQRGYGRTTGWTVGYDVDLAEFGMPQLVRDAAALLAALGVDHVDAVIGHDFGSPVAAWCGLIRPDIFRAVVCMSAPFAGPPDWPGSEPEPDIHEALRQLDPPRRHYQWYYGDREANDHMMNAPGGLDVFLRAYFHCKSGDRLENEPYRLEGWTAEALAELPRYYVMDADRTMAETAASMSPTSRMAAKCQWLTEDELAVFTAEYGRTGFQGGLNWYRRQTSPEGAAEARLFAGRKIDAPSCFMGGQADWGVFQMPGALEAMEKTATSRYLGTVLVEGAGHWVQQEAPDAVSASLLAFLDSVKDARDGKRRARDAVSSLGASFGALRRQSA